MRAMESAINREDLYLPNPHPVDSLIPAMVVMGLVAPPVILFEPGVPEACCEYVRRRVSFEVFLGCGEFVVMSSEMLSLVCRRTMRILLDLVKEGYLFRDSVRREQWCFCDPAATWRPIRREQKLMWR